MNVEYYWIIATLCAFYIKGLCGFANSLIFTSVLSFSQNNINISPVELVLGYPSNLFQAWNGRKQIQWKVCIPPMLFMAAGNIPGIVFLKNADTQGLKVFLGIVIMAIGIEMLIREISTKKWKQSKLLLVLIGFFSGVICGLFGIGAPLSAYVGKTTDDTQSFKANIGMIFAIENTFRLILYSITGIVTVVVIKKAIVLIPFMAIAMGLGIVSAKFLSEKTIKRLIIILLIISGVVLSLQNI